MCMLSVVRTQSRASFLKCLKEDVLDLGQMAEMQYLKEDDREKEKAKRKTLGFTYSASILCCPLGSHDVRDVKYPTMGHNDSTPKGPIPTVEESAVSPGSKPWVCKVDEHD